MTKKKTPTTRLRIETTPFPPSDGPIDLRNISAAALSRYGVPQRPDPVSQPQLAAHWDRVFGRELDLVTSGYTARKTKLHRLGRRNKTLFNAGQSPYWCGSYFEDNTLTYQQISATWQVTPEVAPPTGGGNKFFCSAWIGIGGIDNSTIFQAGTEHIITLIGGAWKQNVYFWYESFPGGEHQVTDVTVSTGDSVSVVLINNANTSFNVSFTNNSTGKGYNTPQLSFGDMITVNSAQWIVERPINGGANGQLADFDPITFTDMLMTADNGQVFQGGTGTLMTMTADDKVTPLAQPAKNSDTSIAITYNVPG